MLIIIAMYGTAQMFTKAALAIYYHVKWMVTDCRCLNKKPMYEDRLPQVEKLWDKLNSDYLALTKGKKE